MNPSEIKKSLEDMKNRIEVLEYSSFGPNPNVHPQTVFNLKRYASGGISRTGTDESRTLSTASGTQTIAHGLGKTPTQVIIHARSPYANGAEAIFSDGIMTTNGTQNCISFLSSSVAGSGVSFVNSNIIYLIDAASAGQSATLTVDTNNLNIHWTKVSAGPTANVAIMWIASG